MEDKLILCVPGAWESREDFLKSVITSTEGDFTFAGGVLAHPGGNDHAGAEFFDRYDGMAEVFEYGGQGRISAETLRRIRGHQSVVYLKFPLDIIGQRKRILKFTEVLSRCGGIAVKLETSGVAHEWETWFALIGSENVFDQYRAAVVLVADEDHYYSCGMHNFGLPDAQVSNRLDLSEAADALNQFNYWRIIKKPDLKAGNTFSLTAESRHFRLESVDDERHPPDDLFFNPNRLWNLAAI